jgi:hypothetical protein
MLGVFLRMALRFLAINEIQSLGLDELVDFSAGNANEEFLCELVRDRLSYCDKLRSVAAQVCRHG